MLTVHHLNQSRSQRVLWALEELQLPYRIVSYQREKNMLAPPALKQIHPLGKSPVVEDNGNVLAESGAILEYLQETYDSDQRFRPQAMADKLQYRFWLHYAEGSAMTPLLLKLIFGQLPNRAPGLMKPLVKGVSKKAQDSFIDPQIAAHTAYWEAELAKAPWFAGDAFSAADIMMSFPLEAAGSRAPYGDKPHITRFLKTIHARPAYQRALERGGPYAYA